MEVDQIVARWDAEEKSVRARLLAADAAPQDQIAERTGMEVFEAIFAGELPPAPIGETLDFVPIHMEPGAAIFQGRPQRKHYNPLGTVHGGWFATLLDSSLLSKLAAAEVSRKYMATSDLPKTSKFAAFSVAMKFKLKKIQEFKYP